MASPGRPLRRPLWPLRARGPWLQLAFALVAACLTLAAAMTLVAFAIYGISEPELGVAFAYAGGTAWAMLSYLAAFTVTFGLAGLALLWACGWRRRGSWLAAGGAAGALFALALGLFRQGTFEPVRILVAAALGLALFALIRWFTGIRAG